MNYEAMECESYCRWCDGISSRFELISAINIKHQWYTTVVGVKKKNMFKSTSKKLITWLLTDWQQSEAESNQFYMTFGVIYLCADNLR